MDSSEVLDEQRGRPRDVRTQRTRERRQGERTLDSFPDVNGEMKVLLHNPVRLGVGIGKKAGDLVILKEGKRELRRRVCWRSRSKNEAHEVGSGGSQSSLGFMQITERSTVDSIGNLLLETLVVDGSTVEARRCSGLETSESEVERTKRRGKRRRRRRLRMTTSGMCLESEMNPEVGEGRGEKGKLDDSSPNQRGRAKRDSLSTEEGSSTDHNLRRLDRLSRL